MPTLIDIGARAIAIQDALFELQGELTPEMEQALDALLAEGASALDAAAWVVRKLQSDEEACKAEAKRYHERGQSFARQAEALKARMLFALDAAFSGKLKTERNTIWGQTSPVTVGFEVAPDADLAEIANTDSELVRRKFELDKIACKNRYEAGDPIPGGIQVVENPGKRSLRLK